jgi:hypothetical protein
LPITGGRQYSSSDDCKVRLALSDGANAEFITPTVP